MHDNDRAHISKYTKNFLSEKGIRTLDWANNSPDLCPIENCWRILKERILSMRPKNIKDLEKKVKKAWESIDINMINKLVESFPRRIEKCLLNKGELTKY